MNKDPFILASGPPTRTAEMISRAFEAGWNGAVTKTICLNHEEMVDVSPRIYSLGNGLKNIELISNIPAEQWAKDIEILKKAYPDKAVIASISAEANNLAGWQKLAEMMQAAGADAMELNFSCPHGLPEKGMGKTCSDNTDIAANITKTVREASTIPVWTKLSPNVTSISQLAQKCAENRADCITAINTVKGFAGVNIKTGKPISQAYGGISGPAIKPVALKSVSEIASVVNCPVSAVGGISNWQDAVEFILLGASTVQLCTAVMLNGYGIINDLHRGISGYFGTKTIDDIRGTSLKHISSFSALDKTVKLIPQIDKSKCVKCGRCMVSCRDAGYQAINENIEISLEKCTGCGLCTAVCPVSCIKLTPLFTFNS